MKTVTADTITDAQIRELREWLTHDVTACDVALRGMAEASRLRICRARCAEILNTRTKGIRAL